MEEERIVMTFGRTGKIFLDFIVKSLDVFADRAASWISSQMNSQHLTGETSWNKLMKSPDQIGIQELIHTEVNLDKLKEELEKYGIAFAFYQQPHSDKVHMAYAMRHEDVVKQAYADVIKEITDHPKTFKDTVKKEMHEQNLNEKLKYYKTKEQNHVKQVMTQKQTTQKQESTSQSTSYGAFEEMFNLHKSGEKSL